MFQLSKSSPWRIVLTVLASPLFALDALLKAVFLPEKKGAPKKWEYTSGRVWKDPDGVYHFQMWKELPPS